MPLPPQGLMHFPGLTSIRSGTLTLSHGISPSAAIVTITPQQYFAVKSGPLLITYGQTKIAFPDCRLDMASLTAGPDGRTWSLRILDRRWKWQFGDISGRYNLRKSNNTIDLDTEKSPQELAVLLLKAMGETRYDVTQLPNHVRPLVEWEFDNPAEQLARLCDLLGCRVVLALDNTVKLCQVGVGAALPAASVMHGGYGFDPPEMPDLLKFVCGPTKYQCKLNLQAVALDTDGLIQPIKDVSYNPAGVGERHGWTNQYPDEFQALIGADSGRERTRALAFENVFRKYRIETPATLKMEIPGFGPIGDIKQLLPIDDVLLDQETTIADPFPHAASAYIEGMFSDLVGDPKTYVTTPLGTRCSRAFSIDKEKGIVTFAEPIFRYVRLETNVYRDDGVTLIAQAGGNAFFPAMLTLCCTFSVRDESKRTLERHVVERKLTNGKFQTGAKTLRRDDIFLTQRVRFTPFAVSAYGIADVTTLAQATGAIPVQSVAQIIDNKKDVEAKAKYYLDADLAAMTPKENLSYSYSKIMAISPDGKIHQVSWSVGESGATTEASLNSEFDLAIPDHNERRLAEIARQQRRLLDTGKKKEGK